MSTTSTSTTLTVSIPTQHDAFIKDLVARGRYETDGDAVRAALKLLQEHERMRDAVRETVIHEICREIEVGIAPAERGEVVDGEGGFKRLRERGGLT